MTASTARLTELDDTAATYFAATGRLYVVVGLIRCARDGDAFHPRHRTDEVPAYECGIGHRVPAEAVEAEVVERFMAESAPRLRSVTDPESIRFLLVGARVTALVDATEAPLIQWFAIQAPIH